MKLQSRLLPVGCQFEVRREHVLDDLIAATKRRSFQPYPQKKVTTYFIGEAGRDTGGLTRELWRLFGKNVMRLCDGKENCKVPRHDATKLSVRGQHACSCQGNC